MSLFEIMIAGSSFILIILGVFSKNKRTKTVLYALLLADIVFILYTVLEGVRWQMVPLATVLVGINLAFLIRAFQKTSKDHLIPNKKLRTVWLVFVFFIFSVSLIFPALLPVVDLPAPSGPYLVGTTKISVVNPDRPEVLTADPDDTRKVQVDVWYPVENVSGYTVRHYWDEAGITGKAYSQNAGMGNFWYSHLKFVETNSYQDAPITAQGSPFPVIIYSPAFYGLNTENTMLMEELASQGYVVFSIAHTYETVVSIFPDGEVIPGFLEYVFDQYEDSADIEEQLYADFRSADDANQKKELAEQILVVDEEQNVLIDIRTEDILDVIDEIVALNGSDEKFKSRFDIDKMGVIGYSFGGAAVINACMLDDRIEAGINLDGWPYGELFNESETIAQPFMIVRSETNDEIEDIISSLIYDKVSDSAYTMMIKDTEHENFWDFPLFFNIYKYIGYWGPISAGDLLAIERAAVVGFLDRYVSGEDVDLITILDGLAPAVDYTFKIVE